MATLKADNVTKYDAGGSGDNVISDGYIKSVEKIWIDSYSVSAAIATTSSLLIGYVPGNHVITDVIVYMPVIGANATNSTVYLCTGATTDTSTYFGTLVLGGDKQLATFDAGTVATLRLQNDGACKIVPQGVGTNCGLYLMIDPATTITGGTIRSIIKYT